ncbi:efflux RND transporter periplasmic adaptor subunit [Bremerella sp. P1]|uniref:efflux RND transporter periplasmic adaptor subunit n=1 Tax=Bremerella sp. P1 TaxID=3026424 RepID=UPI002367B464|nr:HlyD family efflux transporter periplasmic adaptor subunit [Bremerella sp. P1]WDI43640.1 HlyD family efflux transporter periplasmic adaptor subunit [Bremerella sp. P1]
MLLSSFPVVAQDIEVSATLLKIIESVEIPAQQSGVLKMVKAQEGTIVDRGEVIAKIDDEEKILEVEKAKVDFDIAAREAKNDVNIRFAKKSLEVAAAELMRSEEALSIAEKSVSQTEMDRLRLLVEKSRLEIEQSEEKTAIAKLTAQLRDAELQIVKTQLKKHQIESPIQGMVVAVFRRTGEWVETSDSVVKVVRIDRLRAEGFIRNEEAMIELIGSKATVTVDIPNREPIQVEGEVTFVDPEVDPVNGQVRVWVDLENEDLKLRPGLRASMTIQPKQ